MSHSAPPSAWRDPILSTTRWWEVLYFLGWSEFHSRYRAQALGLAWSIVNPLIQMAILSVVVGQLLRGTVAHIQVFMLIGIIVWQWVTVGLSTATSAFVNHSELVKKASFSRPMLPIAVVWSYGINFCIDLIVLCGLVVLWPGSFSFSPALALVPLLCVLLFAALAGIALAASVLNVIYRDAAYAVSTGLSLLYWLTPIVYPIEVVPQPYRTLVRLNPITGIITALRDAIIDGHIPDLLEWAAIVGPVVAVCAVGWLIFRHYEPMMLDHI